MRERTEARAREGESGARGEGAVAEEEGPAVEVGGEGQAYTLYLLVARAGLCLGASKYKV